MPATESDLIGAAEAAKLLGVHRSTVTRMVDKNRLTPAFRGSGETGEKFFHRADIERLLTSPEAGEHSSPVEPTSPEAAGSTGASPVRRAS